MITLFLLLLPTSAYPLELAEITRLAKGGASQLAISLLSQNQPALQEDERQWLRWERVRLRIMAEHGRWPELVAQIAAYPDTLPEEFRHWSAQHHATALINSGDYRTARRLLRELIWQTDAGALTSDSLRQLRRLVLQSYLEEGRVDDAYAAMLRYQQDYGEQEGEARLLRAKVLLAAGRPGEALALLRTMTPDGVVAPLQALATLRHGVGAGMVELLNRARTVVATEEQAPLRWLWLGVMAEAAQQLQDHAALIIALERLLPLESTVQIAGSERRLFDFTAEDLWHAYLLYAEKVGNQGQLLRGDDAAWLAAAQQTEARYPVRKRALYALLAQRANEAALREQAHQALLTLFEEMGDEGVVLLRRLYLEGGRYGGEGALPQGVAYRLVDEAIREADLTLASRLLQRLPQPPGGTALFAWQLRRARVFLLAGDFAEADNLLATLMPSAGSLDDAQRDQLIQLLFQLQGVQEHERAFRLLATLYENVAAIPLRRELLFWMADSRKAQGLHTEAARLYLQSATLSDNDSMDPWAQTARYQAAKSLAEAGLREDATYIYRQLLRVTESPERRSVLRHELQQLRLQGERG
ncbi:MAG: hypothetical protein OQL08_03040 [Gammaproteobacteria bacterium]|nr:hypothetical protein [Gammaproteobacteria bacterium]